MKKTMGIGIVVALMTIFLSGCAGGAEETPTPESVLDFVPVVSVTGEVMPAVWASISSQTAGTVIKVPVEPGSAVAADDLLVQIDSTDTELAVRKAETALESAKADLGLVQADPRPEEIAAAEAQIEAASAALAQATAGYDGLKAGAIEAQIEAAESEVMAAELARKEAEDAYDQLPGKLHGWIEEEAILRLKAAEEALEAAHARLAEVQGGSDAQIQAAEAGVWAARAQQHAAEADLDLTKAGAKSEEIAVARAAVGQAQVALEEAQVALERSEVLAPFAGTVGMISVRVGELIAPGQHLVTLGDLDTLRVETTDLDEIDVARVAVGQQASVTFDALPEQVFGGHVTRISPMAEPGSGGVHYTAIIELDETDPAIRWGMTAFVDIEVDE